MKPNCPDAIMDFVNRWYLRSDFSVPLPRSGLKASLKRLFTGQVDPGIEYLKGEEEILELRTRDESYIFPTKIDEGPKTIYDAAKALLTLTSLYPVDTDGPIREEAAGILSGAFGITEDKMHLAAEMLDDSKIKIEEFTDKTGKKFVKYINLIDPRKRRFERIYLHKS